MSFHIAIAYGVAIVTVVALYCMGNHNQRSGWRRERKDELLDILLAQAAAQAQEREAPEVRLTAALPPKVSTAEQLAALSFVVGANAGTTPETSPGAAERSESPFCVPVDQ